MDGKLEGKAKRLDLIARESGTCDLRLVCATERIELYRGVARGGVWAGEACALKLVRGPRGRLLRHDALLADLMAAQVRAGVPACEPAADGLIPVIRHGFVSFPGDDIVYEVCPWIGGVTLEDYLMGVATHVDVREGMGIFGHCLQVSALVASAVASLSRIAPGRVLVHRDIRPSNVIVSPHAGRGVPAERRAVIIDLDTAVLLDGDGAEAGRGPSPAAGGEPLPCGTPCYAAPEDLLALDARALGARTDVYSLGVVIHEILTGRRPYPRRLDGEGSPAAWRAWYEAGGRPQLDRALPADAAPLVEACLARDPAARPSARDVAESLAQLVERRGDEPLAPAARLPLAPAAPTFDVS